MLSTYSLKSLALAFALVVNVALLAVVGGLLLSTPSADANSFDHTGRYRVVNTPDTTIQRLRVRDASCLDQEDEAATLKVVRYGYQPGSHLVVYRCINP